MDGKAKRRRPASPPPASCATIPALPAESARALRLLWRELIRRTWGADPMKCPCCHAEMKAKGKIMTHEEIEFFLRLHCLWEGVMALRPSRNQVIKSAITDGFDLLQESNVVGQPVIAENREEPFLGFAAARIELIQLLEKFVGYLDVR